MVFRTLTTGTRVRLIRSVPWLKYVRVGWVGEVTEMMRSFVEIRWDCGVADGTRSGSQAHLGSLRLAFSYIDCDYLEVLSNERH